MKNKIYTLSYFRKRLLDNNIPSIRLINSFEKDDPRYWMILICPGKNNIICTCYKTSPDKFFFKFNTKTREFQLEALSMEVVIDLLKKQTESPPIAIA